ncbi:MAG TPA: HAD-IB family hydrolase [Acidimicrobiia bacterium]|nr:HAD-IB family hydrolase [Acidimicrobiia bacterium]
MTRTVAAFDFDGTLTRGDTLVPFLAWGFGRRRVATALTAAAPAMAVAARTGNRDAAKESLLTRVIGGRAHDEVLERGRGFGQRLARHGITADMSARLAWHRVREHELAIVSASLDVYLLELASRIDIHHVVCSTLEVVDGVCTGRLAGGNCRGVEKATRLHALLGGDAVELWAYGNSRGDHEMLALADHPVRVRRGRIISAV